MQMTAALWPYLLQKFCHNLLLYKPDFKYYTEKQKKKTKQKQLTYLSDSSEVHEHAH